MRIVKTLISVIYQLFDGQLIISKRFKIKIVKFESDFAKQNQFYKYSERFRVLDLPDSFNRALAISGHQEFYFIQVQDENKSLLDPSEFMIERISNDLKMNRSKYPEYINLFLPYRYNALTMEKIAKIYSVLMVLDKYVKLTSSYSLVLSALHRSDLSIGIKIHSIEDLFYALYNFRKFGLLITQETDLETLIQQ